MTKETIISHTTIKQVKHFHSLIDESKGDTSFKRNTMNTLLHNYKGYKYAMVVDYLDWNDIYLILTDDDKQKESFLKSKRFEEEN